MTELPNIVVEIDASQNRGRLTPFWCSTGFTPAELLLDPIMKQTLAYCGALPLGAIRYVRIHYLLNLVRIHDIGSDGPHCDWSLLDHGLDVLIRNRLRPIFELMGNPGDYFTGFEDSTMLHHWRALVRELATRCISRYGQDEVQQWYFETWNEPDIQYWKHGDHAFLNYYDACSEGLRDADPALRFGGPGTARTLSSTFKALLAHCDRGTNWFTGDQGVRIDFISVHEKGARAHKEDLTPDLPALCSREEEALRYIAEYHPRLIDVPFMNDECDPQVGWADFHTWHARPCYAALVARMIDQHLSRLVDAMKVPYALLGNDNGFLGQWGQRSQLALFGEKQLPTAQAYHRTVLPKEIPGNTFTGDPFALIRKPVLNAMGLLAYLDGERCTVRLVPDISDLGVLATRADDGQVAVLLHHGCDRLDRSGATRVRLRLGGLGTGELCLSQYRIAEDATDPFAAWVRAGHPSIPGPELLAELRQLHELSSHEEPCPVIPDAGSLDLTFDMPMPGLQLLLLTPDSGRPIPAPRGLCCERYRGLNNSDDALLIWEPTNSRALQSYEIAGAPNPDGPFETLNSTDLVSACYLHARLQIGGAYAGHYRVRAIDVWGRAGDWSEVLCA